MEPDPSSRKQSVAIGYIFAATIGVVVLQWLFVTYSTIDTIPYSEFEQLVGRGSVSEVAVGQDAIQGKLKEKLPSGKSAFVTARVDPALAEKLTRSRIEEAKNAGAAGIVTEDPQCGLRPLEAANRPCGRGDPFSPEHFANARACDLRQYLACSVCAS